MTRVIGDVLIPGRGDPVSDGCVDFDAGAITFAGPLASAPPLDAGTETFRVPCVMPGMWDCHGHFFGILPSDTLRMHAVPLVAMGARCVKDAEAALQAGFTSIREAGGLGVELARVIDEGTVVGPSIYAPGAILSMTGGHGDTHDLPLPWAIDSCSRNGMFALCDGVPECLRAVRQQLRRGAKVIKVCASGGVMSELDDPIHQQFSIDELRAIVDEAGRADRVVMAHCHGKPGILAALEAGCHTIEHGTYLDEECVAVMKERDALLVPTRYIVEQLKLAEGIISANNFRKLMAIVDTHSAAIELAVSSGVRIACGTDIATSSEHRGGVPWGKNGRELALLVEHGMTPIGAIEAATANGPDTLGPMAPRSGQLSAGFDADIIAVDTNPIDDISALGHRDRITHVWKSGTLVKGA